MRSKSRWGRVMALVAIAALGMAACGDDDEETETTTPTTARAQGSASVTVDMTDYAYSVSGPLTAGGTLRVANRGVEFHMMGVAKFKPGKTLADLQTALREAGGPPGGEGGGAPTTTSGGATTTTARGSSTSTTAGGGAGGGEGEGGGEEDPTAEIVEELGYPGNFMSPGESVEITAPNLTPGTYAFVCFLPTEGEGTPHFVKGMINQLEVVEGTAPTLPTADATYRIAPGRAVEGPATLPAGRHTLKIEAASGSNQLEPSLGRLNPGTTRAQADAAFERLFETDEPPPKGAANMIPAQLVLGAFDLEGVSSFYVTLDLKAGNYVLDAEDTDVENPPSPPRETINIRVG